MIDIKKMRQCYKTAAQHAPQPDIQNIDPLINAPKIWREFNGTKFAPIQTKEYLQKCDQCLKIGGSSQQLTYYVYYHQHLDIPLAKIMESYHQASALMQYFEVTKYINIYIIMAPYKRKWPSSGELIGPEHINGGFTSLDSHDIYIIRAEEFGKVILHEIIHHCPQVNSTSWLPTQIDMLKAHFGIAKEATLIPNEAVVEVWATMVHCILTYFKFGSILNYKKLLQSELKHSIFLSNKIYEMQNKMKSGWNEHSNAYAYIVFKTILLKHYEKINSWDPATITDVLILFKDTIKPYKEGLKETNSLSLMITS